MTTEQQLKEAFESLSREVEPQGSWVSARARIEAWHRHRAALAVSLAVIAIVGSAFALGRLTKPQGLVIQPGPSWVSYRHPDYAWTLEHPAEWQLQRVDEVSHNHQETGVLVSNVRHDFKHPSFPSSCPTEPSSSEPVVGPCGGYTSMWDMRGLPASLVVLEFVHVPPWGPVPLDHASHCSAKDTPLPLSLDQMIETNSSPEDTYGAPPGRYLRVTGRGDDHYFLRVNIGSEASEADIAVVRRIITSISFDEARPGLPGTPGVNCPPTPGK
jgi:hypothetical protein